jgi:hypothetical protein
MLQNGKKVYLIRVAMRMSNVDFTTAQSVFANGNYFNFAFESNTDNAFLQASFWAMVVM